MTDREKLSHCIDYISQAILSNGRGLGSEQHNPSPDVDASDARMREGERIVKELREIRERIENLAMGVVT